MTKYMYTQANITFQITLRDKVLQPERDTILSTLLQLWLVVEQVSKARIQSSHPLYLQCIYPFLTLQVGRIIMSNHKPNTFCRRRCCGTRSYYVAVRRSYIACADGYRGYKCNIREILFFLLLII